jgi:hypothetical protein
MPCRGVRWKLQSLLETNLLLRKMMVMTAVVVVVVVVVRMKWMVSCRWRRSTLTLAAAAAVAAVRAASDHLAQQLPVSSAHGALPLPDLRRRRRGAAGGGLHVRATTPLRRDQTKPQKKLNDEELKSI